MKKRFFLNKNEINIANMSSKMPLTVELMYLSAGLTLKRQIVQKD